MPAWCRCWAAAETDRLMGTLCSGRNGALALPRGVAAGVFPGEQDVGGVGGGIIFGPVIGTDRRCEGGFVGWDVGHGGGCGLTVDVGEDVNEGETIVISDGDGPVFDSTHDLLDGGVEVISGDQWNDPAGHGLISFLGMGCIGPVGGVT